MAKEGSVAPQERVNITYKSSVGDAQAEVELPLKMLFVGDYTGRDVWFQGHWGFQYYAARLGARAIQRGESAPAGAVILQPLNNSYLWPVDGTLLEQRVFDGPRWCSTIDAALGAGFYASTWGPIPFAFGRTSPELYRVYAPGGAADRQGRGRTGAAR